MIEVNFCRAPSHYWVGWATYENGVYYASGNTLDKMLYCIKRSLWTKKRISVKGVVLASKQSESTDAPIQVFSSLFLTKYWFGNSPVTQVSIKPQPNVMSQPEPKPDTKETFDYYDTEYQGDTLVVYGVMKKKVAEYKLGRPVFAPPVAPTIEPKVVPFQQPIVKYETTNESYTDAQKQAAKWKPRADIPTE